MRLSAQEVLHVVALISFVAGAAIGLLAVRYYVREDIRGVSDDLSGRARQRKLAESHPHVRSRNAGTARARLDIARSEDSVETLYASVWHAPDEDAIDTVIANGSQALSAFVVTKRLKNVHCDRIVEEMGRHRHEGAGAHED